ncbi:MAG: biosynthetic-type acetolactate synthase large subunit [Sporocytophaga sp.]|uniref:biosynthetic-type acetolactate synthase large subunit n=1 Tax=Sporocytophaga sp. TaxID=2231183 RepID=UPI001AFD75CC|nr:biosynthetic-type acetolactate synthase large subunit [Sporocytophaga sp.]MBO9698773.1 biosynthetic-type acetolactate synthase large subunit [Sporocytophaga sp.]
MKTRIKLRGAEYIVKLIELLGAEDLFAYPGGAILPIYDALAFSKLNSVLVRHEQGASFAANGYARVAGKPGFCLATSGPGATNLVTGIADAYADSVPMIAITGQVALHLVGTDAFQETDITGICIPITKKTYLITKLEDAASIFQEAYKICIEGRPGPVLIDIPRSVQGNFIDLDEDWEQHFQKPQPPKKCLTTNEDIHKAATLIKNAKKPLVIAGHGVLLAKAWDELREFVHRENIPVISTILGTGAMEYNDPLFFQWLGMHGMKYANLAVQESDLIIALGIRFDDRITGTLATFAPKAKIIHCDIDRSEHGKNVKTDVFLHGDLKLVLPQLPDTRDSGNSKARAEWLMNLNDSREEFPILLPDYTDFNEVTAIKVLEEMMAPDAIVTTDVGQHQMWAAQYIVRMQPNHFLTSGGLGSMGFGLPAAMGAQAAAPDKDVWCITGDGSFQMNIQELMTCVQEKWPIKILLLDNSYLGMVRQWQEQFYAKNYSGVELMNPDFVLLAKAFGLESVSVETVDQLKAAVNKAHNLDKPFLIHAKVKKEENVLPMVAPGTSLSDTIYYPVHPVKEKVTK